MFVFRLFIFTFFSQLTTGTTYMILRNIYRSGLDQESLMDHCYLSLMYNFMFYMLNIKCVTVSFRIRLPRCPNIRARLR